MILAHADRMRKRIVPGLKADRLSGLAGRVAGRSWRWLALALFTGWRWLVAGGRC